MLTKKTPRIGENPNVDFDFNTLNAKEKAEDCSNVTLYNGKGGIIKKWDGVYHVGFMNGAVSFSLDKPDWNGRAKNSVTVVGTVVVESKTQNENVQNNSD